MARALTVVFALNQQQQDLVRDNLPEFRVKRLYHHGSIGIRLPDHEVAQVFLKSVDAPIFAPSANLSRTSAPNSCPEVLEQLDGKIDLILDGGPTRYQNASTIVNITGDDMEI